MKNILDEIQPTAEILFMRRIPDSGGVANKAQPGKDVIPVSETYSIKLKSHKEDVEQVFTTREYSGLPELYNSLDDKLKL